ncbi:MAG: replication factor C large subunit [Promethearchaeota archaeon]
MKTENTNLPWVEKYRPRSVKDLVGMQSIANKVLSYVKNKMANQNSNLKPILLEGPPGIGKTSVVYAVAHDLRLGVVEMNASDSRTAQSIRDLLVETSRSRDLMSFMGKKRSRGKILLIDEVDGISGQADRGGLSELLKILPGSKFPVVMTANEYDRRLQSLYRVVERVQCKRIRVTSISNILKRVASAEGVSVPDEVLEVIAGKVDGDVRSAINDFQALVKSKKKLTVDIVDEITVDRDVYSSIFNSLMELFSSETISEARGAIDSADVDVDMFLKWVNENLPKHYSTLEELEFAYDHVSAADSFYTVIQTFQDWGLLPYVYDFIAGGVALARGKTSHADSYVKNEFPYNPRTTLTRAEQEIVTRLKERLCLPTAAITRELLPRLKLLARNKEIKEKVARELELSATGKRGL